MDVEPRHSTGPRRRSLGQTANSRRLIGPSANPPIPCPRSNTTRVATLHSARPCGRGWVPTGYKPVYDRCSLPPQQVCPTARQAGGPSPVILWWRFRHGVKRVLGHWCRCRTGLRDSGAVHTESARTRIEDPCPASLSRDAAACHPPLSVQARFFRALGRTPPFEPRTRSHRV